MGVPSSLSSLRGGTAEGVLGRPDQPGLFLAMEVDRPRQLKELEEVEVEQDELQSSSSESCVLPSVSWVALVGRQEGMQSPHSHGRTSGCAEAAGAGTPVSWTRWR